MKNLRNSIFYILVTGSFSVIVYLILERGKLLEAGRNIISKPPGKPQWTEFCESMAHNLQHPLAILLAQIVTIIFVARFFGWLFRKIGQPTVIGEMIAGIVLGPSLVGHFYPEFSHMLFPVESLPNLQFLSQIGLILFMFVIGMELDLKALKNKANDAVVISHASIIIPFSLGIGLAYLIYHRFAPANVEFASFALFLGIAMSITAFPVLARIVQERGIQRTKLGTIVITCAAADDITAWCILAAVIAIVKAGSFISSLYIIGMAIAYVIIMLNVVRPFLKRVGELKHSRESLDKPVVAIFFLTLIISAYASEVIGIHALFGAFMAGAIMPENARFRSIIIGKVEDVAVILLLPLFFVFTGLRTEIGLINDPYLLKVTALIIMVAVAGKFFGSAAAAKFTGQSWRDSLTIGALMNTRGLMELVVLNIGYDLGVLTTEVFTMMVIMALLTTLMTGPALDLINLIFKTRSAIIPEEVQQTGKTFKILVSFGNSDKGKALLRLANSLVRKETKDTLITAMHLARSAEIHTFDLEDHEKKSFEPVIAESEVLNQKIVTLFKASNDIDADIIDIANQGEYDLLLIGLGQSIFEGTILGKLLGYTTRIINPDRLIDKFTGKEGLFENSPFDERTRMIVTKSKMPVGILVDKNLQKVENVFIPIFNPGDAFLIDFARRLVKNNDSAITFVDPNDAISKNADIAESIDELSQGTANVSIMEERIMKRDFLISQDIMIVSLESWKRLVDSQSVWLSNIPSVLIIRP